MKNNTIKLASSRFEDSFASYLAPLKNKLQAQLELELPELPKHMLHLALNEAEALAWDSGFPQLTLALLAEEKATALLHWNLRQEFLKAGSEINFAA
ncbi:MAG: hypothetical protein ACO1QB_13570 [Verrucomicrobiales bacterium]